MIEYEFRTTPYSPVLTASFDEEWLFVESKKKGWKKSIEIREIERITIVKYKVYGFKVIVKEKNGYSINFHSFFEEGSYNQRSEEFTLFLKYLVEKIHSCNPDVQGVCGSNFQFWLYIGAAILIALLCLVGLGGLILLIMKNHWNIFSPSIILGLIMEPLLGITGYYLCMIVIKDKGKKRFKLEGNLPFELEETFLSKRPTFVQ